VDFLSEGMKERGQWDPEGGDTSLGQWGHWPHQAPSSIYIRLEQALQKDQFVLDWEDARRVLHEDVRLDVTTDEKLEQVLLENGWEVLYTFRGALGMDYTKTVADPIRQVVPRHTIRGFADEYAHIAADVVLLAGETHLYRKPAALRFTTTDGRVDFARMVLYGIRPIEKVLSLSQKLADRMRDTNYGRLWMGAHMRRGDFVRLGWAMEMSIEAHIDRVKRHIDEGREILRTLGELRTYPIPDVHADMSQTYLEPPLANDLFYVATDERDPANLEVVASRGAVFLNDLLTMEDRREFGWPLMVTDVRAVVEQAMLSHSYYFYAHGMSSVAGGVMNMRAARGADPRTLLID